MPAGSGENHEVMSEINIVPFVDIILVVLIIFLIVAPTFINPGLDITLPKVETAKPPANVKVLLTIDIEGQLYMNRGAIKKNPLKEKLKAFVAKNKDFKVVIAADKNVAHGNVIALIDLVRKAGVRKFAVSVESEK